MELETLQSLKIPQPDTSDMVYIYKLKKVMGEWVKKIDSLKYGERLCLNCQKVYGGGNSGNQYCCRGEDGELRFLEQQTGSSTGARQILMITNNLTEDEVKA